MDKTEKKAIQLKNSILNANGEKTVIDLDLENYFQTIKRTPDSDIPFLELELHEKESYIGLMCRLQSIAELSEEVLYQTRRGEFPPEKTEGVEPVLQYLSKVLKSLAPEMELLDKIRENGL